LGYLLTAAIVAGGSKGAVKLFRDLLDWKSSAFREMTQGSNVSTLPPTPTKIAISTSSQ